MKANDVVKSVINRRNMTQGDLTKILEAKSQSGVSATLNRDMRVSTLVRFLSALNCELVIKDTETNEEFLVDE